MCVKAKFCLGYVKILLPTPLPPNIALTLTGFIQNKITFVLATFLKHARRREKLTVVVRWVLVGRAGVVGRGEVREHVPASARVHQSSPGDEQHSRHHGEYLVRRRLQG